MKRLFGIVVFMLSDIVQANSVVVANLFDDPVAVEWGGLENSCTLIGIVDSTPALSAKLKVWSK